MRTETQHQLLSGFPDTHELVLPPVADGTDPLLDAWRAAAADARDAYARWRERPSALTHAAYLALAEQADCAMATLEQDRMPVATGPHAPRRLAA
jgi:hypothetical protein